MASRFRFTFSSWMGSLKEDQAILWAFVFSLLWIVSHVLLSFVFGWAYSSAQFALAALYLIIAAITEIVRSILVHLDKEHKLVHFLLFGLSVLVCMPWYGLSLSWVSLFEMDTIICTLLPALCLSFLLSSLADHGSCISSFIVLFFARFFWMLLPIALNISSRFSALVNIVLCLMFYVALDCAFEEEDEEKEEKKKTSLFSKVFYGLGGSALILLVVFGLGLLPIKPVVIGSGSMSPYFDMGDVVIVSTLETNPEVGDVIQFSNDETTVLHRVQAIDEENGERIYTTKGDANNTEDSDPVYEEQIIGTVKWVIPNLGKLSLWLHSS